MGFSIGDKVKTKDGTGIITGNVTSDLWVVVILKPVPGECSKQAYYYEKDMQLIK